MSTLSRDAYLQTYKTKMPQLLCKFPSEDRTINSPIVEKNDLSPHSATKTNTNVLAIVLAAARIPAPFPEKSETASSA